MSADQTVAILEEGRVVRLFGDRVSERSERLRDAGAPSHDLRLKPGEGVRAEDVRARLDESLERTLRDPISSIATIAGVLRHQVTEAQAEQLSAISRATTRADSMLCDLLDFVRTGMGGLRLARRRIDLKVLCERVVDAIYAAHPDRPMIFTSDRRVDGDWDPDAVETLLSKLIHNAIEHGAPRPAIRVAVHGLADSALVEVWNAGPIADRDIRARLFEPFVSGRQVDSKRGLGLGLYLAREMARAHGGRIDVQSSDGEGTTFRVTLPRA
ncbi:MAG: HAMP domain-containing sensor histidine kinase [Polyangiaceae bacterium]|jgi:signal transduction histidine kinase